MKLVVQRTDEEILDRLLEETRQIAPPVNVTQLAAHLGMTVDIRSDLPETLHGWLMVSEGGPVAILRGQDSAARCRFTAACCIVQWLWQQEPSEGGLQVFRARATKLLLPETMLRRYLHRRLTFPELAALFGVPEAILTRRLIELGISFRQRRLMSCADYLLRSRCRFILGVLMPMSTAALAVDRIVQRLLLHQHLTALTHFLR